MTLKSGLRPAFTLLIGVALAVSACGAANEEDQQAIGSDSAGIGVAAHQEPDTEGEPDSEGDLNNSSATSTSSIPSLDDEADPQVEPVADQRDQTDQGQLEQSGDNSGDQATPDVDKAFCDASADYWVASNASPYIDLGRPGEVSMLYKLMDTRLDTAIDLAPSQELAEPALVAREHFTILYSAAAAARYDLDVLQNGQEYEDLEPSLKMLAEIDNLLGTYLVGPCDYSRASLEDGARSVADDIARLVNDVLTDSGNVDEDYSGDYIEIADTTDRLKVEVPIDWEDTLSEPSANGSALIVGPDVSAYLATWRADGVKMTVKDATNPIDWRAPMYETNASSDCTLISSTPYRDSLYTGWIDRYDNCGGGPTSAVVIGATDEELSVEILIEVQFDNVDTNNDEENLTRILDTFKAR